MFDKELTMSQDRLVKQSMRYINELGLSPQSRAKLGTIAVSKAEKAPTIMDLLADDE
jgi:phage terminase small subunit